MSLEKLRDWVGRTQAVEDFAAPFPVRALIATFDEQDPDPRIGDPLPPLWHWLYFLEAAPQSKIGPDGHAERGDFLPPVPLPRRMWAGSRFAFDGEPLQGRRDDQARLDDQVGRTQDRLDRRRWCSSRSSTPCRARAAPRSSRSTTSSIARRPSPARSSASPSPRPTDATWSRKIMADPVLLFRFSALTFNGHRIHYDQPYVTGTEGYPGLIVHGPLLGMLQIELARRSNPGQDSPRASSSARWRRSMPAPPSRCRRAAKPTARSRPGSPTPRAVWRNRERPPSDEPV